MFKNALLLAALAGVLGHSQAAGTQAEPGWFAPFVGAGLTYGGDQIGDTIQYTNGDTSKIRGGSLLDLRIGLEYQAVASPLSFQVSVGYHVDDTLAAKNGSASFHRFPVEVLMHWRPVENWRFGGGLRKTLSAETETSGRGADYVRAQKYSSSTGFVLEAEWLITPKVGLKLRGVAEEYAPKTAGQDDVDGSHIGVIGVYYFK